MENNWHSNILNFWMKGKSYKCYGQTKVGFLSCLIWFQLVLWFVRKKKIEMWKSNDRHKVVNTLRGQELFVKLGPAVTTILNILLEQKECTIFLLRIIQRITVTNLFNPKCGFWEKKFKFRPIRKHDWPSRKII